MITSTFSFKKLKKENKVSNLSWIPKQSDVSKPPLAPPPFRSALAHLPVSPLGLVGAPPDQREVNKERFRVQ